MFLGELFWQNIILMEIFFVLLRPKLTQYFFMGLAINKTSLLTSLKEYLLMTVGMTLYSFGWICCILPANAAGGGATGLSLLIYHAIGGAVSIGTLVLIVNAILLLIGGFIVGWRFGIKTIYCIFVMSVAMHFLQTWFTTPDGWVAQIVVQMQNITLPDGSLVDPFALNNQLLSVILGGICLGIGIAMCFQQGGSTGGSDIVAMIVNKFYTISYGKFIRYTDSFIISAAIFLPGVGIDGVIYGFVMTTVFSYTVDMILSGNQQSQQIFIICKDYKAMAETICQEMHRGVTLVDSMGWYSKESSKMVMCVCRKRDLTMMLKTIRAVDPDAFITIGSVMGVYGKGFDALSKV